MTAGSNARQGIGSNVSLAPAVLGGLLGATLIAGAISGAVITTGLNGADRSGGAAHVVAARPAQAAPAAGWAMTRTGDGLTSDVSSRSLPAMTRNR